LTPPSRPAPASAKKSTALEDTAMAKRTTTPETPAGAAPTAPPPQREVIDVTGNVARAPELRYTANGTAICNVRIGVNSDDGQTRWFSVAAWGHLANMVSAHVKKGDRLGVRGPATADGGERWCAVLESV
jgi:hypothetical protein